MANTKPPLTPQSGARTVRYSGSRGGSNCTTTTQFLNLVVKQKAVYQHMFRHRYCLKQRRQQSIDGGPSVSQIDSSLSPRHGPEADFLDYSQRLEEGEEQLDAFYGIMMQRCHVVMCLPSLSPLIGEYSLGFKSNGRSHP